MRKVNVVYRLVEAMEFEGLIKWFIKEGNLHMDCGKNGYTVIPLHRILRFTVTGDK